MAIQLVILGCGSATPILQRNPSAQWLRISDCDILIDCAEGTQLQLLRFGLKINKIRAVFISHMHGDHYLGLPGLLSSMHLTGRTAPLQLFGPEVLLKILDQQFEAAETKLNFPIQFSPIDASKAQMLGDFAHFTVQAFPLNHRIPCTGFVFHEKIGLRNIRKEILQEYSIPIQFLPGIRAGNDYFTETGERIPNQLLTHPAKPPASYAYCSDTAPDDSYIPYIKNIDYLYHEATFASNLVNRARETFHSTAPEAAKAASKAGVKKLLIGHFSSRYRETDLLLEEAQQVFPNTQAVFDGMKVDIGH